MGGASCDCGVEIGAAAVGDAPALLVEVVEKLLVSGGGEFGHGEMVVVWPTR